MALYPQIIHVDGALLVVDKPAGLLSIPDGYDPTIPHLKSILEPEYGGLWMVHRLDKDTSGVLILARTEEAHRHLNDQFARHTVRKTYLAILVGVPPWDAITSEAPLRAGAGRCKRTVVDPLRGKPAVTEFHLLERFAAHTLVEAHPRTGRTHQVRAHAYHLGFPILSDPLYGSGEISSLIRRLALHANTLVLTHPLSGDETVYQARLPQDFQSALIQLQAG